MQNRVLLFLTICFVTPSLSNFCQKIISSQFFEMGLTSLPPIWTMSLNILLLFFGSTPKKDQAICWTVMNHWNILSSLESRHTLPSLVSFYLGWWHWTWPRKGATDLGRIVKKKQLFRGGMREPSPQETQEATKTIVVISPSLCEEYKLLE